MAAPPLVVFDVNETLLDLTTMEPTFERIFGDKGAMRFWFANLILYSSADGNAMLCAFRGYRFSCDEDAGQRARH